MHVQKSLKQVGWFVALWAMGVGTILAVGLIIRLALGL
jgi:hypothetical protein